MLERMSDSNHLVELLLHNGSGRNMFQQKSTGVPLCNLSTAFIVKGKKCSSYDSEKGIVQGSDFSMMGVWVISQVSNQQQ